MKRKLYTRKRKLDEKKNELKVHNISCDKRLGNVKNVYMHNMMCGYTSEFQVESFGIEIKLKLGAQTYLNYSH